MFWRIYFLTISALLILEIVGGFFMPIVHLYTVIFDAIVQVLWILGGYSYIYRKDILPQRFWIIFLIINAIYLLLGIIYFFVPSPEITKYLSFIVGNEIESGISKISFVISSLLLIPLLYTNIMLARGKHARIEKVKRIKDKNEIKISKKKFWISTSIYTVFSQLFLFLGIVSIFMVVPESETIIGVLALTYLLTAIVAAILPFMLRKKNVFVKRILLLPIISFILFLAILPILVLSVPEENNSVQNEGITLLSKKELFDAINAKRKENGVGELGYDESTCALAIRRVNDINEKGIAMYGNPASFQRAIDSVFEENPTINWEESPDSYQEFLTYQETVQDAIEEWEEYDARILLSADNYKFGCVAEKNGYGVVIVGIMSNEKTDDQTESYPENPLPRTHEDIKLLVV